MFTVEMEEDETLITVMDTSDQFEDLSVLLYDDYCHIRQWSEEEDDFIVLTMTSEMYYKLMRAWTQASGAYVIDKRVV